MLIESGGTGVDSTSFKLQQAFDQVSHHARVLGAGLEPDAIVAMHTRGFTPMWLTPSIPQSFLSHLIDALTIWKVRRIDEASDSSSSLDLRRYSRKVLA